MAMREFFAWVRSNRLTPLILAFGVVAPAPIAAAVAEAARPQMGVSWPSALALPQMEAVIASLGVSPAAPVQMGSLARAMWQGSMLTPEQFAGLQSESQAKDLIRASARRYGDQMVYEIGRLRPYQPSMAPDVDTIRRFQVFVDDVRVLALLNPYQRRDLEYARAHIHSMLQRWGTSLPPEPSGEEPESANRFSAMYDGVDLNDPASFPNINGKPQVRDTNLARPPGFFKRIRARARGAILRATTRLEERQAVAVPHVDGPLWDLDRDLPLAHDSISAFTPGADRVVVYRQGTDRTSVLTDPGPGTHLRPVASDHADLMARPDTVFDMGMGADAIVLELDRGTAGAVGISADGRVIAISSRHKIKVYEDGKYKQTLDNDDINARTLVLSSDGRTLLTGDDDGYSIFHRESTNDPFKKIGHSTPAYRPLLATSPDGSTFSINPGQSRRLDIFRFRLSRAGYRRVRIGDLSPFFGQLLS